MAILIAIPLLCLMLAIGFGRFGALVAPFATGIAIFHDRVFAGVDDSTHSWLGALSQQPWTLLAVCSWGLVILMLVSPIVGFHSRFLTGFVQFGRERA